MPKVKVQTVKNTVSQQDNVSQNNDTIQQVNKRGPSSAYVAFSKERRPILKLQHPNANKGELSKLLSQQWKELLDDQK